MNTTPVNSDTTTSNYSGIIELASTTIGLIGAITGAVLGCIAIYRYFQPKIRNEPSLEIKNDITQKKEHLKFDKFLRCNENKVVYVQFCFNSENVFKSTYNTSLTPEDKTHVAFDLTVKNHKYNTDDFCFVIGNEPNYNCYSFTKNDFLQKYLTFNSGYFYFSGYIIADPETAPDHSVYFDCMTSTRIIEPVSSPK